MTTGGAGPGADDTLLAAAVRWHSRLREQPGSRAVRTRFEMWLASDPRHAESYAEAERLWSRVGVRCEDEGSTDEAAIEALIARGRRKRRGPGRVAPSLILLALCAGLLGWWNRGGWDDLGADYVTAVGAQRPVTLADGSTLELNTDTSVAVDLAADRREAKLFRGEAFFRVAPDAARPFTVETPDARVRVTGTAFNVRRTDGDTQVSVVEGHVEVTPLGEPGRPAILRAGEEVTVDRRGSRRAGPIDPDGATAWRRGQLVFFDEPLGTVVQELNRYADGRHLVLSPQLRDRRVTGVFNARDIDGALDLVRQKFGVGVFILGGGRLTILH